MSPGIIWTLFLRFANSVTDRKGRFFIWLYNDLYSISMKVLTNRYRLSCLFFLWWGWLADEI